MVTTRRIKKSKHAKDPRFIDPAFPHKVIALPDPEGCDTLKKIAFKEKLRVLARYKSQY